MVDHGLNATFSICIHLLYTTLMCRCTPLHLFQLFWHLAPGRLMGGKKNDNLNLNLTLLKSHFLIRFAWHGFAKKKNKKKKKKQQQFSVNYTNQTTFETTKHLKDGDLCGETKPAPSMKQVHLQTKQKENTLKPRTHSLWWSRFYGLFQTTARLQTWQATFSLLCSRYLFDVRSVMILHFLFEKQNTVVIVCVMKYCSWAFNKIRSGFLQHGASYPRGRKVYT